MAAAAVGPMAATAQTQPLSQKERIVCEDLDFCVDILLRHAPDEFDYDVLAREFQRMGPQGTAKLLKLISGNRKTAITRAQTILGKRGWQFNPAEQSAIAKFWPVGDVTQHARIMHQIGSPMMRNRAVETLTHKDPKVRAASRDILKAVDLNANFRLPSHAFGTLVRALVDDPTPEIITLIGTFPPSQSNPILRRTLLSGDAMSVSSAYTALYGVDAKGAFTALTDALRKLETPEQALAISEMLRQRHQNREDGFYMKFANDLAGDDGFPMLARMAGVDAVMGVVSDEGSKTTTALAVSPKVSDAIAFTVKKSGVNFESYANNFKAKTGPKAGEYINLIWPEIQASNDDVKYKYTALSGQIDSPLTLKILRKALADKTDWRVTREAALALGQRKDKHSTPALTALSKSHPIRDVRVAANAAIEAMTSGQLNVLRWDKALANRGEYCTVSQTNLRRDAEQLPYFDTGQFDNGAPASRTHLRSAAATKNGWLAGYSRESSVGGLIYYDNASGVGSLVLNKNIEAVMPVVKPKLGSSATAFWVIAANTKPSINSGRFGQIYRVDMSAMPPKITRHAQLPDAPLVMNMSADNTLQIGFGDKIDNHPPLRLLPSGGIISGCVKPSSASASSGALPN